MQYIRSEFHDNQRLETLHLEMYELPLKFIIIFIHIMWGIFNFKCYEVFIILVLFAWLENWTSLFAESKSTTTIMWTFVWILIELTNFMVLKAVWYATNISNLSDCNKYCTKIHKTSKDSLF